MDPSGALKESTGDTIFTKSGVTSKDNQKKEGIPSHILRARNDTQAKKAVPILGRERINNQWV